MTAWSLLLLSVFLLAATGQGGSSSPESGVSRDLAQERASRVSDIRYDLALTIPLELNGPITGREVVSFALRDAGAPISLDFDPGRSGRLLRVHADGAAIAAHHVN